MFSSGGDASHQGAMLSHARGALHKPGSPSSLELVVQNLLSFRGGGPAWAPGTVPWVSTQEFRDVAFEGKKTLMEDDSVFLCFFNLFLSFF